MPHNDTFEQISNLVKLHGKVGQIDPKNLGYHLQKSFKPI